MKNFYNTIGLKGQELRKANVKALTQEELIYKVFSSNPKESFTPAEIHKAIGEITCPLTSVRRAITNLTKKGKLTQTENQRQGIYGKPNNCWTLNL